MLLAQLQWYSLGPLLIGQGCVFIVDFLVGAVIHAAWTDKED